MAVNGSSIIVEQNESVVGYAITNAEGSFEITVSNPNKNPYLIICRHISFLEKGIVVSFTLDLQPLKIELVPSSKTLAGVVVNSLFREKNDTTEFRVDSMINLQTRKVEDLIKKLPGFEVMQNGQIKYNDRGINSVLINGENLTGSNYGVVTKNLDADVLSKVQVINNFSENRIIGSIFKTGDVAVNLITKENLKGKINGSSKIGSSFTNRYEADLNIIALKKKHQGILIGNSNNIGEDKNPSYGSTGQSGFLPEASRENSYFNTTPLNALNFPFAVDNYKPKELRKFIFPSVSIMVSPKFKILERFTLSRFENKVSSNEFIKTSITDQDFYILNNDINSNIKNLYFNNSLVFKFDNLKRTAFEMEFETTFEKNSSHLNQYQTGSYFDSIVTEADIPFSKFNLKASLAHRLSQKQAIGFAVNGYKIKDEGSANFYTDRFSGFYNKSSAYNNLRQQVGQHNRVLLSDIFYLARQKNGSLQLKISNNLYSNQVLRTVYLDSVSISKFSPEVSGGLTDFNYSKSAFQVTHNFRSRFKQDVQLKSAIGFYNLKNLYAGKYFHYLLFAEMSGKLISNIFYSSALQSGNSLESPGMLLKDSLIEGISFMNLRSTAYKPVTVHGLSVSFSKIDWLEYKFKYSFRWVPENFKTVVNYDPKLSFYYLRLFAGNFRHKMQFNIKAYSLKLKGTFFADVTGQHLISEGSVNEKRVVRKVSTLSPSLKFVSNFKKLYNFEVSYQRNYSKYVQLAADKLKTNNSDYVLSAKHKIDFSKTFMLGMVNSYYKYSNGDFSQLDVFSSWQVNNKMRLDFKGINLLNQKSFKFTFNDVNNIFRQELYVAKPYFLTSISFKF